MLALAKPTLANYLFPWVTDRQVPSVFYPDLTGHASIPFSGGFLGVLSCTNGMPMLFGLPVALFQLSIIRVNYNGIDMRPMTS